MIGRPIFLLIAVILCLSSEAQISAQTYFDQASKEYVKVDKMQALRTLDEGLRTYPSDPKLLKLAEELVKEDEQQQQEQQKQDQQKQDQQKEEQEQKEKEQNEQGQKDKEQQEKEQQEKEKQQQEQKEGESGEPKDQKGEPQPGSIAPQDALRMLDALERSEKNVQEKVRAKRRPASRRTIEKDW